MKIFTPDVKFTKSADDMYKFDPQIFDNSIFLAGPTPRSDKVKSWRPEAIKYFEENNFQGNLFIPERKNWKVKFNYEDQIEWELISLHNASVVLFWIPRYLPDMPAFTTNVEFGMFVSQTNVYYGRPDDSEKNKYLDYVYSKIHDIKPYNNLKDIVINSIELLKKMEQFKLEITEIENSRNN